MYGLLYPVALVLLFLIALCVWRYGSVPSNLPPGPTGLPILGSSLSTWNNATLHPQLRQWAQNYGPVFRVYVGNVLCVILGDYATICEALVKQGDTYAGRPAFHKIFPKDVAGLGRISLTISYPTLGFQSVFRLDQLRMRNVDGASSIRSPNSKGLRVWSN